MKKLKLILPIIVAGSAALPLTMITSCDNANDLLIRDGSTELTSYYDTFGGDGNTWRTTLKGEKVNPTYSIVNLSNKKMDVRIDDGTVYWVNPTCANETVTFNVKATYKGHVGFSPKITITTLPSPTTIFSFTLVGTNQYMLTKYTGTSKHIYIPSEYNGGQVVAIGSRVFFESNIKDVVIPKTIQTLNERCFGYCRSLTNVTFEPDSQLQSILSGCFDACYELKEINIDSCKKLKSIENRAFATTNIKNLHLPESVNYLSGNPFMSCGNLEKITVYKNNTTYQDYGSNCIATRNASGSTIVCGCKNTIIPKGVAVIGPYSFYRSWELKDTFKFPEGVTTISNYAFVDSGITHLYLPSTLTFIGVQAIVGNTIKTLEFGGTMDQWTTLMKNSPGWYSRTIDPTLMVHCKDGWIPVLPE